MTDKLLTHREVMERTGLSRTAIRSLVSTGDFPAPIRLGRRVLRWPESEFEDWLANRPRVQYELADAA